jgi:hypothetical protein
LIGIFLNQTLTRTRITTNELGGITSEDEKPFPCRAELTRFRVATATGERYQDVWKVFAMPGADIRVNDRIIVAGTSGTGGVPDFWVVKSAIVQRGFSASHMEIEV